MDDLKGVVTMTHAPDDLVVVVAVEGQLAAQKKEHDHSHGPQVRLLAVPLHRQYLKNVQKGRCKWVSV